MKKKGTQFRSNGCHPCRSLCCCWHERVRPPSTYNSVSQRSTSSCPELRAPLSLPELVHNLISLLQNQEMLVNFKNYKQNSKDKYAVTSLLTCMLHHRHSSAWSLFHRCQGATFSDYETVNAVVGAKSLLFTDIFMSLFIGCACIKIITSHTWRFRSSSVQHT